MYCQENALYRLCSNASPVESSPDAENVLQLLEGLNHFTYLGIEFWVFRRVLGWLVDELAG